MQLRVTQLTAGYEGCPVLSDISLTFEPGLTFILGRNGIGKSTLLRTCAGVILPIKGKVEFLSSGPVSVVYIPHKYPLHPQLTGWEHLRFLALLEGKSFGSQDATTREIVRDLDMGSFVAMPVSTYSRGQGQRLILAGALLQAPDFLLLDEPLAGLDPDTKIIVTRLLAKVAQDRVVLATSHESQEIHEMAARLLQLDAFGIVDKFGRLKPEPVR